MEKRHITCDKCGVSGIVPVGFNQQCDFFRVINSIYAIPGDGGETVHSTQKHLCPQCFEKFISMHNNFFKEE